MIKTVSYFSTPISLNANGNLFEAVYFGYPMSNGVFPFRTIDKRWGLADSSNCVICPLIYHTITVFPNLENTCFLACIENRNLSKLFIRKNRLYKGR